MLRLLVCWIAFAFCTVLSAQNEIQLYSIVQDTDELTDLNEKLLVFEANHTCTTIEDLLSKTCQDVCVSSTDIQVELKADKSYWAKIALQNSLQHPQTWVLHLGGKRDSDIAEVYVVGQQQTVESYKTGLFVPKKAKRLSVELNSKVQLFLLEGEKIDLYFKIKNIAGFPPRFDLKLQTLDYFYQQLQERNLGYGLMFGAFLALFIYTFLIFVQNRDLTYLYYAGYTFAFGLNFFVDRGFFHEFIAPNYPQITPYVFIFATSLGRSCYMQFLRYILSLRKLDIAWDRSHLAMATFALVEMLVLFVLLSYSFNVQLVVTISNYISTFFVLYSLVFVVVMLKYEQRILRYVIVGLLALALGALTTLAFVLFGDDNSMQAKLYLYLGVILEILCFALGLGFRSDFIIKEASKAKRNLLVQINQAAIERQNMQKSLNILVDEKTQQLENTQRNLELKHNQINTLLLDTQIAQEELVGSIYYAKKIQDAFLPLPKQFSAYFSDHFVYFEPLEIVSGDFYWLKEYDSRVYIAVGDCTGHGVPGAFLSMLSFAFLNDLVARFGNQGPAFILDQLRALIRQSFHQDESYNKTNDGIRLSLAEIDFQRLTLTYSASFSPALCVRNGQLIEFNGDRMPISAYVNETNFKSETFQLQTGDRLYFYTDGYKNQITGAGNSAVFSEFEQMVLQIYDLPMEAQHRILSENLSDFHDGYPQTDDVVVVGLLI